jgi:hypothetical protein
VGLPGSYAVSCAAHLEADLLRSFWINQKLRDAISEAEIVTLVIGLNDLAQ